MDPVWRAALLAEHGVAQGREVAAGFWDIAAFYDSVEHDALRQAAKLHGFDEVALELGLASHGGPRHLEVQRASAMPLRATRGILDGCALCTTLAKVVMLGPMDAVAAAVPAAQLTLFVDDVSAAAHGPPKRWRWPFMRWVSTWPRR